MKHNMRLHPEPFAQIAVGTKTIEIRLCDEKRQQIMVGDTIQFINRADNAVLETTVTALVVFPSFAALFAAYDPVQYGAVSATEYSLLYNYYTIEDEMAYGVLAIHVCVT